jgi:regulator of replication initiation timing
MSIESKIKELLERAGSAQRLDEEGQPMGAAGVNKDTSIKTAIPGDTTMPRQGGSQDADYEERDETEENQGAVASKSTPNSPRPANTGAGQAPNYMTTTDPTAVVNMQASSGNKPIGESEEQKSGQPSLKEQLSAIFGDDLSEDFREKATAIFEAAVIARVNGEMEKIASQIEEQKTQELADITEGLVDKIDSFMNYVVEQWMEDNKLQVESGLRTEIAEDFITGLKTLFQEHYIEVPEDKVDVLEELNGKAEELEEKLNSAITENVELTKELSDLKKALVLSEMTEDLADTEAEKLTKLLEGVSYDSEQLFREKVKVVKENYFPRAAKSSPEEQILNEEAPVTQDSGDTIAKYAAALSRAVKVR